MTTFRIALIGGTGPQGKGLAYRWARHGHEVVIGSRSAEKAVATAHEVADRVAAEGGAPVVSGATNAEAAGGAEVVVLAVPYAGHDELVASLAGAPQRLLVGQAVPALDDLRARCAEAELAASVR